MTVKTTHTTINPSAHLNEDGAVIETNTVIEPGVFTRAYDWVNANKFLILGTAAIGSAVGYFGMRYLNNRSAAHSTTEVVDGDMVVKVGEIAGAVARLPVAEVFHRLVA